MSDDRGTPGRAKRMGWAVVGGILVTALPAAAQSPSPAPSASAGNGSGQPPDPGGDHGSGGGPGGAPSGAPAGQRPDETVLAVYEAHMTEADGAKVTVKFDKNFAVTAIQDGMGSHK